MSVLLFIIILAVLVLIHEVGHFIAARSVGARVDEFGIGFPPRAWSFKPAGSETEYSVNWIPFGGFVRILGENGVDEIASSDLSRSLTSKSKLAQAWVLAAGVIFNILFGWILLSGAFMAGVPMSVMPDTKGLVAEPEVTILETLPDSPAMDAGIKPGSAILALQGENDEAPFVPATIEDVQEFIGGSAGLPIVITYREPGAEAPLEATVRPDINENGKGMIGVSLDLIGTVKLSPFAALIEGARSTGRFLVSIAQGLGSFVRDAFVGTADYSQISGPVGIVGIVGDVSTQGALALLSLMAIISLNLAVINLVPFPALDGGRILFVIIEAITRRPLPKKVTQWANVGGFLLLILLMVIITVNDVIQLIN